MSRPVAKQTRLIITVLINVVVAVALVALIESWLGWKTVLAPWQLLEARSLSVAMLLIFGSYLG